MVEYMGKVLFEIHGFMKICLYFIRNNNNDNNNDNNNIVG